MQRFSSRTTRVCAAVAAVSLLIGASGTTARAVGTEEGPAPSAPTATVPKLTLPGSDYPVASTTPAATGSVAAPVSDYELGKQAVAASNWKSAIALFAKVTKAEPKNADAWNLYAYSVRKSGNPSASIALYAKALKLNPKHRGALEYQGEAYVQLKQVRKAKANLAKLKAVCGVTCEEYLELAEAING